MKIRIKFSETTEYEAIIEVPDNYPKTEEDWYDADNETAPVLLESNVPDESLTEVDGEDWFQRLEQQAPKWFETCLFQVNDRVLMELEPVSNETPTGPTSVVLLNVQSGEMLVPTAETS